MTPDQQDRIKSAVGRIVKALPAQAAVEVDADEQTAQTLETLADELEAADAAAEAADAGGGDDAG